ncbi:MAG TPA: response regulator transcription factor [Patescibacteria group bacterium]|nr:response regulator transcription factor [Patescibacteria group bacterium]
MKLLVIEDNRTLADSLRRHLSKTFVVDVCKTAEDGLKQAFTGNHDLIILDLHLPDGNGLEICQTLRAAQLTVPILILTAVTDVPSRVTLLNAGADDYVTKPFSMVELRARLNALLRRAPSMTGSGILTVQDLILDPARRQVARAGQPIELRRKEFDILEYLVRHRGQAVSRTNIVDHAWDTGKETWHNTVDVHIKHIRDKIDRPFEKHLIKTAYGIGYMIDDV